jgi:2-oxoglutarate dehydrogenase complex dehydrogenase (E1) component-like enzyme
VSPSSYGLIQKEHPLWTLDEVVRLVKRSYCNTVGWELNHILSQDETAWLHSNIEDPRAALAVDSKRAVLKRLMVRLYSDETVGES